MALELVLITGMSGSGKSVALHAVEDAGYDHLLIFDHVLGADSRTRPGWDGAYDHTHPFLEPLVLFAFLIAFFLQGKV